MQNFRLHIPGLFRYLVAGGTGAAADLLLLFLFVHAGMEYLVAVTLAFILATVVSFTLQKFWAFENRELERVHIQASLFLLTAACNVVINTGFVYIFVSKLHIFYLVSQVVSSALVAVYSFFIYKFLVFKKQKTDQGI